MPKPHDWPATLDTPGGHMELVGLIARDLRNGVQASVITQELQAAYGLAAEQATSLLDEANQLRTYVNRPTRPGGIAKIQNGALWLVVGLVLSILSYLGAVAQAGNGRYLIAIGAIAFGAINIMRGISDLVAPRE